MAKNQEWNYIQVNVNVGNKKKLKKKTQQNTTKQTKKHTKNNKKTQYMKCLQEHNWASSRENLFSGFPTMYDSNRPAQQQSLARF